MLRRALLSSAVVFVWLSAACAAKEEVIPIIHVSPGFESRLALRPPTGAAAPSSSRTSSDGGDAGAANSATAPSNEK